MKRVVMMSCVLAAAALLAAPGGKGDPVAEGYPDWHGISAKSYIMGREICPSDLRHKVTVVLEIEPSEKLQDQFVAVSKFVEKTGLARQGHGDNWETKVLPRDLIVLVSCWNAKNHEAVMDALKYEGEDRNISQVLPYIKGPGCSVYENVTFTGAPDGTGKRPFIYVMGPEGKEPLCQGELVESTVAKVAAAIGKGLAKLKAGGTWEPFYGTVSESKYTPQIAKAIEKGKPLDPIAKTILKDVQLKDEEQAKTAQIAYDALNQTRSDLLMRIKMEVAECPHRAYYDVQRLVKHWPSEKKRLEAVYAKFKSIPEVEPLAKMYCKAMMWADPNFTCKSAAEAKKIVNEINNKMKKSLEKMKESKVIIIQNGALLLDAQLDELAAIIPTKVPAK